MTSNKHETNKNVDINKSQHGYIVTKALIDAEIAIQLYFFVIA